ncbi:hypothetical protein [Parasediminibacterium sp. JCM 36343]|uniref:hypothetical protein n=1 Tax=Parasediminibacterium sp. JCM 36343 TaxID=3374279 RepID=UPI00397E6BF8
MKKKTYSEMGKVILKVLLRQNILIFASLVLVAAPIFIGANFFYSHSTSIPEIRKCFLLILTHSKIVRLAVLKLYNLSA